MTIPDEHSRGFAGLAALITALGALDAALAAIAARAASPSPPPAPLKPAAASAARPAAAPTQTGGTGWWIAAGIAAFLIWGSVNQPPRPSHASPPRSGELTTSSIDVKAERMPAIAVNAVLGEEEIRYCLFQGKRLEGASSIVDQYSPAQVGRYNALVNDYNGRCSSFRYRSGTLERLRREAESQNLQLGLEGAALLDGYR